MSSTSSVTLMDFVEKLQKSKEKSYSEWLKENGDTTDYNFSKELENANKEYDRARATYGKTAESLSKYGLTGSGYASFLDANAYSELQSSKRAALERKNLAEAKNKSSYSTYLTSEKEKKTASILDAINNIVEYNITDYDSAYKLGLASGLDEEGAALISELGTNLAKSSKGKLDANGKRTLIMQLLNEGVIGKDKAREVALACGLSEEDADDIARGIEAASSYTKPFFWDEYVQD